MTQQASSQQQNAEQAGTMSGVQTLKTKGHGEETALPLGNRGHSYGNLSQEVKPYPDFLSACFVSCEHKLCSLGTFEAVCLMTKLCTKFWLAADQIELECITVKYCMHLVTTLL